MFSLTIRLPQKSTCRFMCAVLLHVLGTLMCYTGVSNPHWSVTPEGKSLGLLNICDGTYCYEWPEDFYQENRWKLDLAIVPNLHSIIIECVTVTLAITFMVLARIWKKRSFKWMVYGMTLTFCASHILKLIGCSAWLWFVHNPRELQLGRSFNATVVGGIFTMSAGALAALRRKAKPKTE